MHISILLQDTMVIPCAVPEMRFDTDTEKLTQNKITENP